MENKITLKEFLGNFEPLCIHCKTQDQARKLCKAFNDLGEKWNDGKSYLYAYYWNKYKENTCYTNRNTYYDFDFFKSSGFKIYEFEDVIF